MAKKTTRFRFTIHLKATGLSEEWIAREWGVNQFILRLTSDEGKNHCWFREDLEQPFTFIEEEMPN